MRRTAVVAFEYRAVRQDELTGLEGDTLIITKEADDGWVCGSDNTGATGWFPMLYLDFMDDGADDGMRAPSTATNYTSIHSAGSGGSQRNNDGRQRPTWQQQHHTQSHHQQPNHHQYSARAGSAASTNTARLDMFANTGPRSGSVSAGNAAAPPLPPARSSAKSMHSGGGVGTKLPDSSKIGSFSGSSGGSMTATQALASGPQRINMPAPLRRAASSLSGLGVMFDGYGPLLDTGVLLHRTKEKGTGKLRHVFFFEQAVLVCKLKGTSYNIKVQEQLTKDVKVEDLVWVSNKADEKQANEQAGFAFKRASDGVVLQRFACTGARGIDDKLRYLAIVSRHLMSLSGLA